MLSLDDCRLSGFSDQLFTLSLNVRPGSVRDTVARCEFFCASLCEAGEVRDGEKVLVVGGGPAAFAVSAALLMRKVRVATCNLPVGANQDSLITCMTRVICPTTNDFPTGHWQGRNYPESLASLLAAPPALAWKSAEAATAIQQMLQGLKEIKASKKPKYDYFDIEPGELIGLHPATEQWEDGSESAALQATIRTADHGDVTDVFRAVVLCVGAGTHTNALATAGGIFRGYGWWSDAHDAICEPTTIAGRSVIVLGGGDSGVADFARLLTGRVDPFDCLEAVGFDQGILDRCADASRNMWNGYESKLVPDHIVYCQMQERLLAITDEMWARPANRRKIEALLLADRDRPRIQLAVSCYHFGLTYPANTIIAHMLARAVVDRQLDETGRPLPPFRVGVGCKAIRGLDKHVCQGDVEECANARHRIKFNRMACLGRPPVPAYIARMEGQGLVATSRDPMDFDRVVLRLPPNFVKGPLPSNIAQVHDAARKTVIRQVPPFYIP